MKDCTGRVIALDVGDVRIGVAVSDPSGTIAQPVEVYRRVGYAPDCKYILALSKRYHTTHIVLGLPLHMDGTRGPQADKTLVFGRMLEEAGLWVDYQDERMTTMIAERALISSRMRRDKRRQTVDKIAATMILEQWLATNYDSSNTTNMNNSQGDDQSV